MKYLLAAAIAAAVPGVVIAEVPTQMVATSSLSLPVNSLVEVTPAEEITSKKMKEGTTRQFLTVNDVNYQGVTFIPRGSLVTAEVTWRTGKGIVGKSAKFELTFRSVRVDGREHLLRGTVRQEGRGNTAGALLGTMIITGRSAAMSPGQIVNVFTAEPISVAVTAAPAGQTVAATPMVYVPAADSAPSPSPAAAGNRAVRCVTC